VDPSRGFEGGWADIPADGEVEIVVSKEKMTVNGAPAMDKKAKKQLERDRKDAAEKAKKEQDKADREAKDKEKEAKKEQEKADREAKDKEKEAEKAEKDKPKEAAKKIKVGVVGLVARTGLEQAVADLYCDALVGELRKRPGMTITDRNDIAASLGAEKEKQLLGCSSDSCMADLAGALGVEQLVRGTVGRVGKSLLVNFTLVDSKKGQALNTVNERLKSSSDEAFFDALPDLVNQLTKTKRK